jgi:hypothetical protein
MAAHTPGPWTKTCNHPGTGSYAEIRGNDNSHICIVGLTCPADEGGASLIAAAPTMQEALEEVLVGLQFYLECHGDRGGTLVALLGIVTAALEKARGD